MIHTGKQRHRWPAPRAPRSSLFCACVLPPLREALAAQLKPAASAPPTPPAGNSDDEAPAAPAKPVTFASLGYDDLAQEGDDVDDGLMSYLAKSAGSKKKDKKKPKRVEPESDAEDKPAGIEVAEVDPDSWMEDEFGPTKPKKGKKGGKKSKRVDSDDEVDDVASKVEAVALDEPKPVAAAAPVAANPPQETGGVLSKAEKERIKKEKEKVRRSRASGSANGPDG